MTTSVQGMEGVRADFVGVWIYVAVIRNVIVVLDRLVGAEEMI